MHPIGKDRFPAVPPAQDVADGPFVLDSALRWHGPILRRPGRQVKRNPGQFRANSGPNHGFPAGRQSCTVGRRSRGAVSFPQKPSPARRQPVAGHLPAKAERRSALHDASRSPRATEVPTGLGVRRLAAAFAKREQAPALQDASR
jgi:hypothetical protein